jgi:hypothetical protein
MIKLYSPKGVQAAPADRLAAQSAQDVLWVDLLDPTPEEIRVAA